MLAQLIAIMVCLVSAATASAVPGVHITVLKQGPNLTVTGTGLDPAFAGVTAADVSQQDVDDAALWASTGAAQYTNYNSATTNAQPWHLYKFDLSVIPADATIYKAQLRLNQSAGNTSIASLYVGRVITHNWEETVVTRAGPDGPVSPNKTWGPNSDSVFDLLVDGGTTSPLDYTQSVTSGAMVEDVTADVQGMVNGTLANYGWFFQAGNRTVTTSENVDDGKGPALFVYYYVPGTQTPTTISDLSGSDARLQQVTLNWTAPSDDTGPGGAAASYEIRYSTAIITEESFVSATLVAQNLVPKAPGQTETLAVTGLTPDTLYYFAIKSTDVDGMVSSLSNVLAYRTTAPDVTPPDPIGDLRTSDLQPRQLTLAWTATGDDGNVGTAVSYEIRLSTSPIDAGNFGSATAVAQSLVPKAAGQPETLTITKLAPTTTYYFAIKATDDAGNTSLISNVFQVTTPVDTRPVLNFIVAFKEGSALTTEGEIDAMFQGTGPADISAQDVQDTKFISNSNAAWELHGFDDLASYIVLLKYDLSSIPADATIIKAQLRLHGVGGNSGESIGRLLSHDWTEALCTQAGPNNPRAPGFGWGPQSNAIFSEADYGPTEGFDSWLHCILVKDVTDDVRAWVTGSAPSYGWALPMGNYSVRASENPVDGERPVLYVNYQYQSDPVPPRKVLALAAVNPQLYTLTLTWPAPRDISSYSNPVASYEIRMSTSPIDTGNWSAATIVSQSLTPQAPNQLESLVVHDLVPSTTYYFALKGIGTSGLVSEMSNVASATTLPLDFTPPATPANLRAIETRGNLVLLGWTASGDDGMTGHAFGYDIRYSMSEITEANFPSAMAVPQSLVPQMPGQTETLAVTGLTPGQLYWFAVKMVDEQGNWSAAAVISAATPLDATAPAAVSDLSVTVADAFSANLSWAASGDDGATGTASGYQIRYSTGMIDESNWASASVAFNFLAPQTAGSGEAFRVCGLQPNTTYYFAIKVKDEASNLSGLSNVTTCTTTADPGPRVLTSTAIQEKSGQTTINYPVMLSQVFLKGDVPGNVIVRAAGQYLATQMDVKTRWADGSVRHALVSFMLPQLNANETVTVEFCSGGPNANSHAMSREQLLAGDFDARMTITINGIPTVMSGREMVRAAASVDTWLAGDVVTEFLIRDLNLNIQNQLNVQYRVRVFSGWNGYRVDTVVENVWCQYRGNVTYDFTLSLGEANAQMVFSKTGITHTTCSRWHQACWAGDVPGSIYSRFNMTYIISTGLLYRYDLSLVMDEGAISTWYSRWLNSKHGFLENGCVMLDWGTTGMRQDIGPVPAWTARYIISQDPRTWEMMMNSADVSGYVPIHWRESDKSKSFYGRIVSIDDRPTVWLSRPWQVEDPKDYMGDAVGPTDTTWGPERAHQPCLTYVPYLLCGEYYYLEENIFYGGWNMAYQNYNRGTSEGLISDQVRGIAWALRCVLDAWSVAPDSWPEKAYFARKLQNNFTYWTGKFFGDPATHTLVRWWTAGVTQPDNPWFAYPCANGYAPWQLDFVCISMGHARDLGWDTRAMVKWLGVSLVNRFSDAPGWNRFRGASYSMPARRYDETGAVRDFATMAEVDEVYRDQPGPTRFGGDSGVFGDPYLMSYAHMAKAALSNASSLPNWQASWDWLVANANTVSYSQNDPTWAILPNTKVICGDADDDGAVNLADLKLLVAAWNTEYGDAAFDIGPDFDADATVNLPDLKLLVANWNQSVSSN